jgi:hypothetical protein
VSSSNLSINNHNSLCFECFRSLLCPRLPRPRPQPVKTLRPGGGDNIESTAIPRCHCCALRGHSRESACLRSRTSSPC